MPVNIDTARVAAQNTGVGSCRRRLKPSKYVDKDAKLKSKPVLSAFVASPGRNKRSAPAKQLIASPKAFFNSSERCSVAASSAILSREAGLKGDQFFLACSGQDLSRTCV